MEEIIEKVTAVPAKNFHLAKKGQLTVGFDADLTIFEIVENEKELKDSNGFTRIAKRTNCSSQNNYWRRHL